MYNGVLPVTYNGKLRLHFALRRCVLFSTRFGDAANERAP